jgi:NAD(P)-dependent dehydrogenase (short-subunit alcohol dehydrogenase family)
VSLADKSIVVTGATGIAAAAAHKVAQHGGRVFVIAIDEEDCRSLISELKAGGASAGFRDADLTVEAEADEAFNAAVSFLGGIDGLFAVAGGSGRPFGDGAAHEVTMEAWEKTQQMNVSPMFLAVRNAIRHFGDSGGSIVVITSVLATSPSPHLFGTHAYAASKGAANAFVTALASYYAEAGIRVNAIAAGLVRTPMSARAAADPETVAYAGRKQPLAGGLLEPEAIADAAVFLLSDESSQITGQVLSVDGGWGVTEA